MDAEQGGRAGRRLDAHLARVVGVGQRVPEGPLAVALFGDEFPRVGRRVVAREDVRGGCAVAPAGVLGRDDDGVALAARAGDGAGADQRQLAPLGFEPGGTDGLVFVRGRLVLPVPPALEGERVVTAADGFDGNLARPAGPELRRFEVPVAERDDPGVGLARFEGHQRFVDQQGRDVTPPPALPAVQRPVVEVRHEAPVGVVVERKGHVPGESDRRCRIREVEPSVGVGHLAVPDEAVDVLAARRERRVVGRRPRRGGRGRRRRVAARRVISARPAR